MASDAHPSATIDSTPKHDQIIQHNGMTYQTIKEGLAYILVPSAPSTNSTSQAKTHGKQEQTPQSVFYNPIQQFNRDLSVLAIRALGQDLCERRLSKRAVRLQKQSKKKGNKRRKGNEGQIVQPEENHAGNNGAADVAATTDKDMTDVGSVPALEPAVVNGTTDSQQPKAFSEEEKSQSQPQIQFRILDALSATGLRALRYAHEIEFATHITANDLLQTATDAIRLNIAHNRLEGRIRPVTGDARAHMYSAAYAHGGHEHEKYDVIDLDPYGTAAPFLDAAIEAVNDGGMLCVTCTDAGVFASCGYLEKTFALYGGLPIKGFHSHEGGLRLILGAIASKAATYGKSIEPLLSLSIDFYARIFVRIHKSPEHTKLLAGKMATVQQCDSGCGAWTVQPIARNTAKTNKAGQEFFKYTSAQAAGGERCVHCGFKPHIAGPMWMGLLHNPFFISKILSGLDDLDKDTYGTTQRIEGMLTSALDELDVHTEIAKYKTKDTPAEDAREEAGSADTATAEGARTAVPSSPSEKTTDIIPSLPPSLVDSHPFSFSPSLLSKVLHCCAPPEAALKGALRRLGYVATRSHTKPGSIKTQAPWSIIWHVMREWIRQRAPIKTENQKPGSPGWAILGLGQDGNKAGESADASRVESEQGVAAGPNVVSEEANTDRVGSESLVADSARAKISAGESQGLPEIVFDEKLGSDRKDSLDATGRKRKLVRYQPNPRANWGPMTKAAATK